MDEKTKAWISGPAASWLKYQVPNLEVPVAFQEMAEKGVAQTKETLVKAKAVAEAATDVVQHTYGAAFKGIADYNLKLMEIARINTNSAFDYAQQLLGVKSPSELAELSGARARQQFETMTSQTQELSVVIQKSSSEIVEPLQTGVAKAFKKVA